MSKKGNINIPYQLFALALCVLVVGLLIFDTTQNINEETKSLLMWADYALAAM